MFNLVNYYWCSLVCCSLAGVPGVSCEVLVLWGFGVPSAVYTYTYLPPAPHASTRTTQLSLIFCKLCRCSLDLVLVFTVRWDCQRIVNSFVWGMGFPASKTRGGSSGHCTFLTCALACRHRATLRSRRRPEAKHLFSPLLGGREVALLVWALLY